MLATKKQIRKKERLEARVTAAQKELIQHAAQIQGRTVTDFVVNALQDAAEQVVREQEMITLTSREREIFVEAMLNPPKANEKLLAHAKFYKQSVKEK